MERERRQEEVEEYVKREEGGGRGQGREDEGRGREREGIGIRREGDATIARIKKI